MDSNGKRILSKYYEHSEEFVNSTRKQESLEKSIHEKTRKQNSKPINFSNRKFIFKICLVLDQIALVNEHVVLYKTSNDVTICLVGRSEDSNELLLYTAVETIHEALCEIIK
mgnify:CR=1 FL=1